MWTQKGNPRGRTGAGSSTPPSSHPLCPHRLRGAELFRDPGKPLVKPYLQCTPLSQSSQYLPSSCWSSSRKNSTLTIGPSQYCPALRRRKSSAETCLFLLSLHVHRTEIIPPGEERKQKANLVLVFKYMKGTQREDDCQRKWSLNHMKNLGLL